MKGIILAAGRGSRMKSQTENQPKCLSELGGKTLIRWQIDALEKAGVSKISVVTGYLHETLRGIGASKIYNAQWHSSEMLVSLRCAEHLLSTYPCIVSYSDIFYESKAISSLAEATNDIAILYDPHWEDLWRQRFADPLEDAETFALRDDGTLRDIGKKPSSLDGIQGQYMGLLYFTPNGWKRVLTAIANLAIHQVNQLSLTGLLSLMIGRGEKLGAIPYNGCWGEVDSETDLQLYNNLRSIKLKRTD